MASMKLSTGAPCAVGQSPISKQERFKMLSRSILSVDKNIRDMCNSLSVFHSKGTRLLHWHLPAMGSETSITEKKKNDLSLGDVKIVVESRDGDKIHVRVELTCDQTQKAFDDVLLNLARSAPPMPGFRRTKGGNFSMDMPTMRGYMTDHHVHGVHSTPYTYMAVDPRSCECHGNLVLSYFFHMVSWYFQFCYYRTTGKTSNVPKSFLVQMLGQDRVTKFVIQEIVSTAIRDYVEKERLLVKSKIDTSQTAEQLQSSFSPGSEFGFNATIEIEHAEPNETEMENSYRDA